MAYPAPGILDIHPVNVPVPDLAVVIDRQIQVETRPARARHQPPAVDQVAVAEGKEAKDWNRRG
jgi:hypothetical protein